MHTATAKAANIRSTPIHLVDDRTRRRPGSAQSSNESAWWVMWSPMKVLMK